MTVCRHLKVILFAPLLMIGCAEHKDEYFLDADISDRMTLELSRPLNNNLNLRSVNHYKIEYDRDGRIARLVNSHAQPMMTSTPSLLWTLSSIPTTVITYRAGSETWDYFDEKGQPTKHDGFYSIRIMRDRASQSVTWYGYNKCGKLVENEEGVCQVKRQLNGEEKKLTEILFDRHGRRVTDSQGVYELRYVYNDNAEVIEESNYDEDGNLLKRAAGYSTTRYEYDDRGNVTRTSYFDVWGNPAAKGPDNEISYIVKEYDNRGNSTLTAYYSPNGELIESSRWSETAVTVERWNSIDSLIEQWRFDADSNLIGGTVYVRDDKGAILQRRNLGSDSQLVVPKWSSSAMIQYQYDESGNKTEIRYYGTDELPIEGPKNPHIEQFEYDEAGRRIRHARLDGNGELVEGSQGIAVYEYTYWRDTLQHQRGSQYGKEGQLKSDSEFDIAIYEFAFDSLGNIREDRYYGPDGTLALRSDRGAAIVRFEYDEKRRLIRQSYHGTDGRLVMASNKGHAVMKQEWNQCGYLSELCYFDERRELIEDSLGIALYRFEYDNYGNRTRAEFYDENENLHEDSSGFAVYVRDWDERGRLTRTETYDRRGKLKANAAGIAIVEHRYDDDQDSQTTIWYDERKQRFGYGQVFAYRLTVDSMSRISTVENLDKQGDLTLDSTGIAMTRVCYDQRGLQVEEAYYDLTRNLAENDYGYAFKMFEYDERVNMAVMRYLDTEKHPVKHKVYGCAEYHYEYDENGNRRATKCLDQDGRILTSWKD